MNQLLTQLYRNANLPTGSKGWIHTPTGRPCTIMRLSNGRAFVNFGARNNPFCSVLVDELEPAPEA